MEGESNPLPDNIEISPPQEISGVEQPKEISSQSAEFLMAEYERLSEVGQQIDQRASRRFEFYLTLITAVGGAYLLLLQTQTQIIIPKSVIDLVALAFLIYGAITFLNMTFASVFGLEIFRAQDEIRRYFIERDTEIGNYFYFKKTKPSRSRIFKIIPSSIRGGSEKLVITLINSAILTYLLLSLLENYFFISLHHSQQVLLSMTTFVVLVSFHATYVRIMYKQA
ncbi:MAG: hypothetical protein GXO35_07340 [Gammaproteobacteria bacterium]|nr:hypothetical protein [Gammaproteobacteria bacterium]